MSYKFRAVAPKSMKDRTVQTAIGAYEKLAEEKYAERAKAIVAVYETARILKNSEKQADVLQYLSDVVNEAAAERKRFAAAAKSAEAASVAEALKARAEAKKKAYKAGVLDGAGRKPSRASEYAKVPQVMAAYVEGFNFGLKVETKPTTNRR